MTTLFMQSPGILGATPLGTIAPPTPAELNVFGLSGLQAWWRADIAFNGGVSWLDRKSTRRLVNNLSASPTVQALGIGSKPTLVMGPQTAQYDPDNLAFVPPTGDWTVVFVGKPNAGVAWAFWGLNSPLASAIYAQRRADEKFEMRQNLVQLGISTAAFSPGAPFYFVDSWEQAATLRVGRANGAQVLSAVTAAPIPNAALLVGAGATGGSGAGTAGQLISEVLVFNRPLAKASNAADLATVESYIAGRYGAVFA